jgi:hypothetical protein
MLKSNFSKSNLFRLISVFALIAILPIIFLYYKLGNQTISNDISDWSDFGGFVSGTTNTIISIFSLIILAYLTYFVGQQSNKENKNVNLLMRKLDAYDALASHMPRFNIFAHDFSRNARIVMKELKAEKRSLEFQNRINNLIENISYIYELNYFLYSFSNRYGHLFDYNFAGEEYRGLTKISEKVNQFYSEFAVKIELEEEILSAVNMEDIEELAVRIQRLMIALSAELK